MTVRVSVRTSEILTVRTENWGKYAKMCYYEYPQPFEPTVATSETP